MIADRILHCYDFSPSYEKCSTEDFGKKASLHFSIPKFYYETFKQQIAYVVKDLILLDFFKNSCH